MFVTGCHMLWILKCRLWFEQEQMEFSWDMFHLLQIWGLKSGELPWTSARILSALWRFRPVVGADFSVLMMSRVMTGVLLVPLGWYFSEAASTQRNITQNATQKHMESISFKTGEQNCLPSKLLRRFATASVKRWRKQKHMWHFASRPQQEVT